MAQMEVVPGDPARNGKRILELMDEARGQGVDLLVFPEMCLPGYLLGDMWERPAFLKECELWSNRIIGATAVSDRLALAKEGRAPMAIVFGTVVTDWQAKGEDGRVRKYNAYFAAQNGQALRHPGLNRSYGIKTLLPNYREFEETRHFYDTRKLAQETGVTWESLLEPIAIELSGLVWRVGIVLCEDAWEDDYAQKPLEVLGGKACDFFLNLSCSPFTQGKNEKRNRVFYRKVKDLGVPLFYVNGISLQNNSKTVYTFDGRSTAYDPEGRVRAEMPAFKSEILSLPLFTAFTLSPVIDPAKLRMREIYDALRFGAKTFLTSIGQTKVVIGISGGIDSAVVAALFGEFLAPENLLLVNMPSQFNSQTTRDLAKILATNLGCLYCVVPIDESVGLTRTQLHGLEVLSVDGKAKTSLKLEGLTLENVQARDRSSRVLAAVAAAFGGVFTCNANKAELTVGYSTLYGDLGGFLALLGDLWKSEVYALGRFLNEEIFEREVIPEGSFTVVPSAELSVNQAVDEGKGDPLIYPYHDRLFFAWVQRWNRATPEEILEWYAEGTLNQNLGGEGFDVYALFPNAPSFILDLEKWWLLYNGMAVAKRLQAPPILAVSSRAFGFDHREHLGKPFQSTRYLELRAQLMKSLA
jgi:NAD+ synthase (glutamine-hydrolysing)